MGCTLAVERSVAPGSWALYRDGACLAAHGFDASTPRAPAWVAELRRALAGLDVAPDALTSLVVGTGPGSFSGIRAAIAALQGLALPRAVPLYGVPSAEALAHGYLQRTGETCAAVIGDARRNRLWCAAYRRAPDGRLLLAATGDTPAHTGADVALVTWESLTAAVPDDARVLTPDGVRLAAGLARVRPGNGLPAESLTPSAADLGALFLTLGDTAPRDPVPVYLHPAVDG